ncbi:MAG: SCO family protein, partial [Acidimicrobiales bacterium]
MRTRLFPVTAALLSAVIVAAAIVLGIRLVTPSTTVPSATARFMSLSDVPNLTAPSFSLVDQHGHRVTLASLRGKTIVLEFMDPHCTDICPIVSHEFVDAYHDLGSNSSKVVFLAINVNPFHEQPSAMMAFSREQGLDTIPSWHFVTGTTAALRAVWSSYGIYVDAPGPNIDVHHSSYIFFITPSGK